MKIENTHPKISIYELKKIVENITYDETAMIEIDFYNKEFQRHSLATIEQLPEDRHKPVNHILLTSFDLTNNINNLSSIKEDKFDILKMKLIMLVDDFILFIQENGLEDLTWSIVQ